MSKHDSKIAVEEARRKVDSQLEQKSQIESKSMSVLQLVITVLSVTLTGTYVLYYLRGSEYIESELQPTNNLSAALSNSSPINGELIVNLLIAAMLIFGAFFVYLFFVRIPVNSFRAIEERDISTTPLYSANKSSIAAIEDDYRRMISQNEEILRDKREFWENCYESVYLSTLSLALVTLLGTVLFVDQTPSVALLLTVGVVVCLGVVFRVLLPEETKEKLFQTHLFAWIITVLGINLAFWSSPQIIIPYINLPGSVQMFALYLVILSLLVAPLLVSQDSHASLVLQLLILWLISGVLLAVVIASTIAAPWQIMATLIFLFLFVGYWSAILSYLFRESLWQIPPLVATIYERII